MYKVQAELDPELDAGVLGEADFSDEEESLFSEDVENLQGEPKITTSLELF